MMRKPITAAIVLLAVSAGCKQINTTERAEPTYKANVVNEHRVTTDIFLADKAKILQIRQATVSGNLLRVDVEVQNDKTWQGNFDYAFDWFDQQGMPFDTPTDTWISRSIGPGETVSLDAVAPSPQCKDFRLKLRRSLRD